MPARATPVGTIHRLRIELRHVEPAVWRRVEIASDSKLPQVSRALLAAMGWENSHLHAFHAGAEAYSAPLPELPEDMLSERNVTLAQIAPGPADEFGYDYDFGDDWQHEVTVEAVAAAEPEVIYPRCLAGENACPPEDCGGPPGYESLLEILAKPKHRDYRRMRRWAGADFDPATFDLVAANARLARLAPRRAKPSPTVAAPVPPRAAPPDRSAPCPCGSGRKYKRCCGRGGGVTDLPAFKKSETNDVLAMLFALTSSPGFRGTYMAARDEFFGDFLETASESQRRAAIENEQTEIAFNTWLLFDAFITADKSARLMDTILAPDSNARLNVGQRIFLERMAASHMRPYVVREVRRDEGMLYEDMWNGELVDISERAATHSLHKGQTLFARIIEGASGRPEMHGAVLATSFSRMQSLLASLRASLRGKQAKRPGLNDVAFFKESGPRIMRTWLEQYLIPPPTLTTTDGESVRPQNMHFDVLDRAALISALRARREFDESPDGDEFVWLSTRAPRAGSGTTILGELDLHGSRLAANVLSDERAQGLRELLERIAPGATRFRLSEVIDLSRSRQRPDSVAEPEIPDDVLLEMQRKFQAEYDRAWLDMSVPALDGRTPRRAAALKTQRAKVAALLREIESNPSSTFDHDLTWIWEELKLTDLR